MPISQSSPMLLTRNLLYTGLTRAKKLLIVIGNERVIDYMINNVDSKKRNTGLEFKMKNMNAWQFLDIIVILSGRKKIWVTEEVFLWNSQEKMQKNK